MRADVKRTGTFAMLVLTVGLTSTKDGAMYFGSLGLQTVEAPR
jgi:hypothetical protein